MTLLASPLTTNSISPDDLLKMDGLFELVDGQLIEKTMSSLSGRTAVIVASKLHTFLLETGLGDVMSETTFRCFPNNPDQVRRPDLAFISSSRLSRVPEQGHVPIAPDIAIEIVSPGDSVYDLDDKLLDYKSAGVPLIWIFNPHIRNIRVFRPGHHIQELTEADQLSGDTVIPGFSVPVSELFPAQKPTST